jgi:hypothetical protein
MLLLFGVVEFSSSLFSSLSAMENDFESEIWSFIPCYTLIATFWVIELVVSFNYNWSHLELKTADT